MKNNHYNEGETINIVKPKEMNLEKYSLRQEREIAIIGVGIKVANVETLDEYWSIFENGIDCIREMPEERVSQVEGYAKIFPMINTDNVKFSRGTFLEEIDEFDYPFFKITPREAELMEPAQRILLQTMYNTFVDAGYTKDMLAGTKTGAFIGYTSGSFKDNYLVDISFCHSEFLNYAMTGNMPALMPSRISQLLDLHGPTMILDTACSSSLVAVHQACESIRTGVSDMAIAGGVKLNILPIIADELKLGIESADDRTRAFDNAASGTGIGEGVFCILLKDLVKAVHDGDHIYGVIKGSSINHDGTASSLTAPNPSAQEAVIVDALEKANVNPEEIAYVETHGTATILGDPIEFQGLNNAYKRYTKNTQFCALSASKSNLGHLYEAAGLAALIKALAAIKYKKIPGTKHFNIPNLRIDFSRSPFYVNTYTKAWDNPPGKLRTCGISAFGLSGTNCHVILQEYAQDKNTAETKARKMDICCISAQSDESLHRISKAYSIALSRADYSINDIIYNLNANRHHYKCRLAIVFSGREELVRKIDWYNSNDFASNKKMHIFATPEGEIITDTEVRKLSNICNNIFCMKKLNETNLDSLSIYLDLLAKYYLDGQNLEWNILYKGIGSKKLSLPGYSFQNYHMWLPYTKNKIGTDNPPLEMKKNPLYYKKSQVKEELSYKGDLEISKKENILLLSFPGSKFDDLLGYLQASGCTCSVIKLKLGSTFSADNLRHQFENIDFHLITKIVLCVNSYVNNASEEILNSILSVLLVVINLYRYIVDKDVEMMRLYCLFCEDAQISKNKEHFYPEWVCLIGMCKSLNRGSTGIHLLCIETKGDTSFKCIVNEIIANSEVDLVRYQGDHRYVEGLQEVHKLPLRKMLYRNNGVYIISGGLGGIGFETAKELSKKLPNATIVLLGKSKIPPKEMWGEYDDFDISQKIQKIMSLDENTGNVVYYSCDVADYKQVELVITKIKNDYGKLNGIIHAAGVGGGIDIDCLNIERVSNIIAPKAIGAYNLDKATSDLCLDFFVMFSSVSTVFSSFDLPDYIAANMFLESFAEWRTEKRVGLSLTVAWATWSETGMSLKNQFTIDTIFKALNTSKGIRALFQAMDTGMTNLIIGELNFDSKIILLTKQYPIYLSEFIKSKIKEIKSKVDIDSANVCSIKNYSKIEGQLCAICCKVLGYSTLSIEDNFFELGADSIMLGHIFKEICKVYPDNLNITDLFEYPTIALLSEYIELKQSSEIMLVNKKVDKSQKFDNIEERDTDVAIIGVGMFLPNANNLEEYWEILNNGVNVIREIPTSRGEDIVKHFKHKDMPEENIKFMKCGYLDRINTFDYTYFNMSPRESMLIEPAGRLFLECCATAIEDSGYGGESIKGTRTGVFLGYTANIGNAYSRLLYEADESLFGASMSVNQISMMASRVAYVFDLKGPSVVLDTACSSSLVALHMACEQIRNNECDMALAGGASIMMTPLAQGLSIGFESPESKTRAFSDKSSGTAIGEGVCSLLIKSLKRAREDGDHIYAVIKGSAINQDGSSQGIAAPNYLAQSDAIVTAWRMAGVTASDISYIEAHGTGTQLGDPIEIKGINHAFQIQNQLTQTCGIGSVKTNIGHLNEASGLSGILKIILMLKYRIIPPSLGFSSPNLNIDFVNTPVYVVSQKTVLNPKKNLINIGINGFGMSGTNCHIVLQESPNIKKRKSEKQKIYIFTASAKTEESFWNIIKQYVCFLTEHKEYDLGDLCYTVNTGRFHFPYRFAVCFQSHSELLQQLKVLYHAQENRGICGLDMCIGHYVIVPENKEEIFQNELTLSRQRQLSLQAQEIVCQLNKEMESELAKQLIKLYLAGATIKWVELYTGKGFKHIHLPTYPFEQYYCWFRLPETACNIFDKNFYFEKRWIESSVVELNFPHENGSIVILFDFDNVYKELPFQLEMAGKKVIKVYLEYEYKKVDENTYCVGSKIEDYKKLFYELKDKEISRILHMTSTKNVFMQSKIDTTEILDNSFYDLILLIKGMAKAGFNQEVQLIIIANNAYSITSNEQFLIPENAAILSLGKVIEQENPKIDCYAIDVDLESDVNLLCQQLLHLDKTYMYAIRRNKLYQEERIISCVPVIRNEVIHKNQIYLITGGTSGIGLEIVNYISRQNPCTIIIISRNGFAAKTEWEKLKEDDKYAYQIKTYESILERGCNLYFEKCDVSQYKELETCISRIHQEYGNLHGVFHCAGVSGAGYILRKDKEAFIKVMQPKIFGTKFLDQLTRNDDMAFMMICSSAVTDSGEAGQSDYVAANAFIDAFTDYRNLQGRATYTVNWVSWKDTGMAVRHGINIDGVTKALSTEDAIKALDQFMKGNPKRIMIGQYNQEADLNAFAQYSRTKMSDELIEAISKNEKHRTNNVTTFSDGYRDYAKVVNGKMMFIPKSDKMILKTDGAGELVLTGDKKNEYSPTERIIGEIYSKTLGYTEINVYNNFFELGGDSIMLSGMYDLISERMDEVITIADLFEYTNIRELSKFVDIRVTDSFKSEILEKKEEEENKDNIIYPLSLPQQRIFYDNRINKGKHAYNNPFLCDLTEYSSDVKDVINFLVQRHEILKTKICVHHSKLMQQVMEISNVEIETIYVDSLNGLNYNDYLKTFNLMEDLLINLTLFIDKDGKKMLLFDSHHIILDGYSSSFLQEEMKVYYESHVKSKEIFQYREYVSYEQKFVNSKEYVKLSEYWLQRMSGFQSPQSEPSRIGEKRQASFFKMTLDEENSNIVRALAQYNSQTVFSVFLFIVNVVLYDEWKENDIVLLCPTLNRSKAQFKRMLGAFVNLIPFRTQVQGSNTVLVQMQEMFFHLCRDLQNQSYQYNDLVKLLQKKNISSSFNMYIDFEDESLKLIHDKDIPLQLEHLKYDLDFIIKKRNFMYDIEIAYDSSLLSLERVKKMTTKFNKLIQSLKKYEIRSITVDGLLQQVVNELGGEENII